jgi:homoserine dehydrogenase
VAIVSAIGNNTDTLLERARKLIGSGRAGSDPFAHSGLVTSGDGGPGAVALAALLATGEATSAALLGLALDRAGVPFTVLDAGRIGPFTHGPQLDGEPYWLDCRTVNRALDERPVAVLPGFVGRDDEGNFSLLGRGGSDLTALFVAHRLKASRCRLLKDVDGVYEHDPAKAPTQPHRYASLSWSDALALDGVLLQQKAIQFAHRHNVAFEVGQCGNDQITAVGAPVTELVHTSGGAGRESLAGPKLQLRAGIGAGSAAP